MGQIAELMTAAPLATIGGGALVAQASRVMGEQSVSHLLVLDDDQLVGVVCVCDLDRADTGSFVRSCVTRAPLTLDVGVSIGEAAQMMRDEGINCLPLTRQGVVAGIVTTSDLRRAGVLDDSLQHCAACGSDDHIRCHDHGIGVGFCIECTRSSAPPRWDDDLGGD